MSKLIYAKNGKVEAGQTDLPDQYIPGRKYKVGQSKRESVVIWKGFVKSLNAWAEDVNISPGRLRERISKVGVCQESMETPKRVWQGSTRKPKKKAKINLLDWNYVPPVEALLPERR